MIYLFALCSVINLHKFKLSAGNEISRDLEGITPGRKSPGDVPGDATLYLPREGRAPGTFRGRYPVWHEGSDEGKKLSFSDN